jgi:hypothetical protein
VPSCLSMCLESAEDTLLRTYSAGGTPAVGRGCMYVCVCGGGRDKVRNRWRKREECGGEFKSNGVYH